VPSGDERVQASTIALSGTWCGFLASPARTCRAHPWLCGTLEVQAFIVHAHGIDPMDIEEINKQLGTTTKLLMRPMLKLLEEGKIKKTGEKRATTYFPA